MGLLTPDDPVEMEKIVLLTDCGCIGHAECPKGMTEYHVLYPMPFTAELPECHHAQSRRFVDGGKRMSPTLRIFQERGDMEHSTLWQLVLAMEEKLNLQHTCKDLCMKCTIEKLKSGKIFE